MILQKILGLREWKAASQKKVVVRALSAPLRNGLRETRALPKEISVLFQPFTHSRPRAYECLMSERDGGFAAFVLIGHEQAFAYERINQPALNRFRFKAG